MSCHWTILDSVIICIASVQMSLKLWILLILKSMLPILTFTLKSTMGEIKIKLYDKRDNFTFPIVNFSFISSNIPVSPAFWAFISQLIRYSSGCAQYSAFLDRTQLQT